MKPESLIVYKPEKAPIGMTLVNHELKSVNFAIPGVIYTCKAITTNSKGYYYLQVEELCFGYFPDGAEVWCLIDLWEEVLPPDALKLEIQELLTAPIKPHFVEL